MAAPGWPPCVRPAGGWFILGVGGGAARHASHAVNDFRKLVCA